MAGGLIAGLGVTGLRIAGELESGEPSELIALERASARHVDTATAQDEVMPVKRRPIGPPYRPPTFRRRSPPPAPPREYGFTVTYTFGP